LPHQLGQLLHISTFDSSQHDLALSLKKKKRKEKKTSFFLFFFLSLLQFHRQIFEGTAR